MFSRRSAIIVLFALLLTVLGSGASPPALGFSGGIHDISTQRAVEVMKTFSFFEAITGTDPYGARRTQAGAHIFPELSNDGGLLGGVLSGSALGYDDLVGDMGTRSHFWTSDDDLDECPEGIKGLDNAWEKAYYEWLLAVQLHRAGLRYQAMEHLGAVVHLVQDMTQPAHTNSDLHGPTNRDSLEEWGGYHTIQPMYSWTNAGIASPGQFMVAPSKQAVITRVLNHPGWAGQDEFLADPLLSNPNDPFNTARLFSIMYRANQWGNYFASDGESGNRSCALGWIDYQALGFPTYLNRYGVDVPAQQERALDDNEGPCDAPACGELCCNCDGDLMTIARCCYRGAMRATGGVIELFRQTVDSTPPTTQVDLLRADGKPFVVGSLAWSNSPLTLVLRDATDPNALTTADATGVWTVYALIDHKPWSPVPSFPATELRKAFVETGHRSVTILTTDNAGNTEHRFVRFNVDVSRPTVDFTGMHDWYFSCEQVKALWKAKDVGAGVKASAGKIDGTPVAPQSIIAPALVAPGSHRLEVAVVDLAENSGWGLFPFTVYLETGTVIGKPRAIRIGSTRSYVFKGTLTPQHHVDSTPVTLTLAHKEGLKLLIRRRVPAVILADGTYRGVGARLEPGVWAVRASHVKPSAVSALRYFTVE